MENISAQQFFNAWSNAVNIYELQFKSIWRDNFKVTNFIKGAIIEEVALGLNLLFYPEDYYLIDAIFYKEEDKVPNLEAV